MVVSPALGAYLMERWSVSLVVTLATAVAILDVFFILVAVPESLPEKVRPTSTWGSPISWEQADPFSSLRNVGKDPMILMLCITVFLSYLPEAGQYSCIFVYLKLVSTLNLIIFEDNNWMLCSFLGDGLVSTDGGCIHWAGGIIVCVITAMFGHINAFARLQTHHYVRTAFRDVAAVVVWLRNKYLDDVGSWYACIYLKYYVSSH